MPIRTLDKEMSLKRLLSEKKNRTSDELMVCVCASIESVWNVFFFM